MHFLSLVSGPSAGQRGARGKSGVTGPQSVLLHESDRTRNARFEKSAGRWTSGQKDVYNPFFRRLTVPNRRSSLMDVLASLAESPELISSMVGRAVRGKLGTVTPNVKNFKIPFAEPSWRFLRFIFNINNLRGDSFSRSLETFALWDLSFLENRNYSIVDTLAFALFWSKTRTNQTRHNNLLIFITLSSDELMQLRCLLLHMINTNINYLLLEVGSFRPQKRKCISCFYAEKAAQGLRTKDLHISPGHRVNWTVSIKSHPTACYLLILSNQTQFALKRPALRWSLRGICPIRANKCHFPRNL